MMISKNINFKDKIKHFVLFKIIIFIILTWIYQPINDVCNFEIFLEKEYKIDSDWSGNFSRILSKHGVQYELKHQGKREKLPDNNITMDLKKDENDISTYRNLKRVYLNDLDEYKKRYKHRHSKKKGIAKLDCYFEKKIFDNVDYIYDLGEKWQGEKNAFIKKILKKIAIRCIVFAIFPVIGITLNVLFKSKEGKGPIIPWCRKGNCMFEKKCSDASLYHFNRYILESCLILSTVLWYASIIIFIIFIIYIFIKVIKYERLKEGKTKMNVGEYCQLCKDIFT